MHNVRTLLMLGDLTDAKDYHPAQLTNRLVKSFQQLREQFPKMGIVLLMGNHDYLKGGHPYFKFLEVIPNLTFVTQPTEFMMDDGPACLFLPHSKNPTKDWAEFDLTTHYDYVFMHQTVKGAVASNGQAMDGEALPIKAGGGPKIYSGDIHVPQIIGGVEYVGSPYHVHFGDSFKPRCVLLDRKWRPHDLHFPNLKRVRLKISDPKEIEQANLRPGDQIKIDVLLSQAEAHDWRVVRRQCLEITKRLEVEVHGLVLKVQEQRRRILPGDASRITGVSPAAALEEFVLQEDLGADALEVGLELLS